MSTTKSTRAVSHGNSHSGHHGAAHDSSRVANIVHDLLPGGQAVLRELNPKHLSTRIRRQPLRSMALAVAIGFVVGFIRGRT